MPTGRILCVTSSLPRWAGDSVTPFVLHLAQDLQSLGWQVDLVAPHAPGAAVAETLDGVHVERFRYAWPASLETLCYGGGALANLARDPSNKLKLPLFLAAEWLAVARRLARKRYDVLHSHWLLPQGFVGMLACGVAGTPHVATIHGGDLFALRSPFAQRLKRMVLARADAVTVNSSYTEAIARQLLSRPLERIPMGVGIDPPDSRRSAELRQRFRRGAGPLLVFAGRLVEEKGAADVIGAMDRLQEQCPDATALIIGDGPDRSACEDLAKSLRLESRIAFPGWIDTKELGAWLAAGDVFVAPSRRAANGWVEAQGLALIEAMIAGTPVIATRLGGVPDAVIDGQTGLLVDERSPEQIAAAARRLFIDAPLARTLAEQGRRHASAHFSRQASAQSFAALFTRLISRPR